VKAARRASLAHAPKVPTPVIPAQGVVTARSPTKTRPIVRTAQLGDSAPTALVHQFVQMVSSPMARGLAVLPVRRARPLRKKERASVTRAVMASNQRLQDRTLRQSPRDVFAKLAKEIGTLMTGRPAKNATLAKDPALTTLSALSAGKDNIVTMASAATAVQESSPTNRTRNAYSVGKICTAPRQPILSAKIVYLIKLPTLSTLAATVAGDAVPGCLNACVRVCA